MSQCCRLIRTLFTNDTKRILSKSNVDIFHSHKNNFVRTLWTKPFTNTFQTHHLNFNLISSRNQEVSSVNKRLWHCRNLSSDSTSKKEDIQIYYGNLTTQIRAVKFFSLVTSITGLAAQPMLIQKASEMSSLGVGIAIGSFVGFFTFITPILLHWVTKKYVTYLHYNPETKKYTATTFTLFLQQKKTTFSKDDIQIPEVSGMFSSFEVNNGIALFVDPRLFSHPEHYGLIMGYDKPLNFKINANEEQDNKNIKS